MSNAQHEEKPERISDADVVEIVSRIPVEKIGQAFDWLRNLPETAMMSDDERQLATIAALAWSAAQIQARVVPRQCGVRYELRDPSGQRVASMNSEQPLAHPFGSRPEGFRLLQWPLYVHLVADRPEKMREK